MLKTLTRALLFCSILAIKLPDAPHPQTLTLGHIIHRKAVMRQNIRKIQTREEKELSAKLIDAKMAELLRDKDAQSVDSKVIRDFAGHDYVVARYGELGYGILNVANDDVVEIAPFSPLPFDWASDDVRYLPWVGCYEKKDGRFFRRKKQRGNIGRWLA